MAPCIYCCKDFKPPMTIKVKILVGSTSCLNLLTTLYCLLIAHLLTLCKDVNFILQILVVNGRSIELPVQSYCYSCVAILLKCFAPRNVTHGTDPWCILLGIKQHRMGWSASKSARFEVGAWPVITVDTPVHPDNPRPPRRVGAAVIDGSEG